MSDVLFYLAMALSIAMVAMAAWAVFLREKYMFYAAVVSAATLLIVASADAGWARSCVILAGILFSCHLWQRARKVLDTELTA